LAPFPQTGIGASYWYWVILYPDDAGRPHCNRRSRS
jgi:hypothetical protein